MAEAERSGEAARMSAIVEAWLAERGRPQPADPGALLDLRLALARICEAELVARDAEAQRYLREMAFAEDMDALHGALDRLGRRVAALIDGDGAGDAAAPAVRGRPARRLLRL